MDEIKYMPILIVEDERPLVEAVKDKLERDGFSVLIAKKVEQAIGYVKDNDFKISAIWLDHYLLGNKNGLDFISELKNDERFSKIPVYVVTNTGAEEKKETYLKLGATKYFIKSDHRLDDIIKDIKDDLHSKN